MIVWGGSYRSQRRDHTRAARLAVEHRLSAVADRAVMLFTNRRRPVQLSEQARVLETLRSLHTLDALPVSRASRFDRGCGSQAAAVATRPRSIDRSDQSKAPLPIAAGRDENHGAWSEPT